MGDDSGSNLEMRCSADEAWYDGTLRISPESKDLIVVHFNDFGEEEDETFHTSELRVPVKLRSRVRVRSVQLQDSQCRRVYEMQKICGCLDDGEDRKYYDAKVLSITKKKHAFKDEGEECLCKFKLLWLDGPRKGKNDDVGCAEVCFLSIDAPEDDPMVKNLLKSLAASGDHQQRRKLVKSAVTSRPRTPSPSLELASSKKQPSKDPSPSTQPNQKALEPPRTRSLPIGSKKKRIMQAEEEQTDLASDNDALNNLGMVARQVSSPKHDQATGHGESDAAERRPLIGGSESKKGAEKKRLVKGKAKVATPEVVREEAVREDIPRPASFKERLKFNTAKMAASDVAVRDEAVREDTITQSLEERVKLKTAKMAAPATPATPASPSVAVRDAAIRQDVVTQSLGERVKLKTAKKKPASPIVAHKISLQKVGKQVVGKHIMKRKLIQLEDPSPLSSKFDKAARPRTPSKPKDVASKSKDVAAEPKDVAAEPKDVAAEPKNVEAERPVQKRKAGRPRKHPLSEPAKIVTESVIAKKQQVVGISSEHKESPQEEIVDANAEKCASDPANKTTKKKRPRDEERSHHDNDDTVSDKSSQENETLAAHVRKQASAPGNKGKKKKLIIGDHDRLPHDDAVSDKSAHTNDIVADQEDNGPLAEHVDEANEMSCHMQNKSIAEKFRDIENKFGGSFSTRQQRESSVEKASSRAAQDLVTLGTDQPPCRENIPEEQFRVSSPHENSASHLRDQDKTATAEETGVSGKKRRRKVVLTDDEMDDAVPQNPSRNENAKDFHGSDDVVDSSAAGQDENSPVTALGQITMSDPKNTSSALDEEVVLQKQDGVKETRLLLIENMETDVSAFDAMQVLQNHTEGVCAVHVLPVFEFQASASGYALYRDNGSAAKALRWLTSCARFVVSPEGRPWIVSQATDVYGPRVCGFASHTAYKSDDPGVCGIISDQPHEHDLVVVTKRDHSAYFQAQQMSKTYEEHKKWQKELYERIVQHGKKG